ncbi:MAG: sulfatase [Candidatus Cryptobacteroides sp.]
MKKRETSLTLGMLLPLAAFAQQADNVKPNILYIVIDDMGWGDLGYMGSTLVETPNIDRLASMGVSFTNGYATAGTSCPSRNGLVSGAYQQRFGVEINADYKKAQFPESQLLLPQTLALGGYHTALVGKWHVVRKPEQVFETVIQPIEISSNYFPNEQGEYNYKRLPILASMEPKEENEYMTDRLTTHAIEYMDSTKTPFFLYLGYNAVHNPWQACQKYYDRLDGIEEEYMRVYASLIASLDDNVGRILNYLEEKNQLGNTVIVMLSDNGPAKGGPELKTWAEYDDSREYIFGQTSGLRGHKVDLYEGGIRTPMAIVYPPKFRAGKVFPDMISTMDFYPTVCELAGVDIPQSCIIDGVSLVKYLREETKSVPHRALFWKRVKNGAMRLGAFKLVFDSEKSELFLLRDDMYETKDVSDEYPHIKEMMLKEWAEWEKDINKTK